MSGPRVPIRLKIEGLKWAHSRPLHYNNQWKIDLPLMTELRTSDNFLSRYFVAYEIAETRKMLIAGMQTFLLI